MKHAFFILTALIGIAGAQARTGAATPTVDHLVPAGGQRGTKVAVKVTGKFDAKTRAWCSRDGVKLALDTKARKLTVTIPKNARPGVCWLRLYNAEGSSPSKAFVIGTLPETAEKEPNDSIGDSQQLASSSMVVNGVLSKTGEVDTFAIAAKKGQTLVASLTANNTLGSPMDGVLQVVSPRGFVLAQNDDDRGFDPQIAFPVPEDGVYHVRCFAFPATPNSSIRLAGAANYVYRLTITTGPFLDHTVPLAVSHGTKSTLQLRGWNIPKSMSQVTVSATGTQSVVDVSVARLANAGRVAVVPHKTGFEAKSGAQPRTAAVPSTITGHVDRPGDVDAFDVNAKKGQTLRFRVEARSLGSPLDPVLQLLDAKGAEVARAETRSSTAIDETLTYRAPADGRYRLEVTDLHRRGGWRYVYRLTMGTPAVESLSVAKDRFSLIKGKPLVIPVTVSGSTDPDALSFQVHGLPKGVTVQTSLGSGKSRKSRGRGRRRRRGGRGRSNGPTVQLTLTTRSATAFSGPIEIAATAKGSPLAYPAEASVDGTGRKARQLWLTVTDKPAPKSKKSKR